MCFQRFFGRSFPWHRTAMQPHIFIVLQFAPRFEFREVLRNFHPVCLLDCCFWCCACMVCAFPTFSETLCGVQSEKRKSESRIRKMNVKVFFWRVDCLSFCVHKLIIVGFSFLSGVSCVALSMIGRRVSRYEIRRFFFGPRPVVMCNRYWEAGREKKKTSTFPLPGKFSKNPTFRFPSCSLLETVSKKS